MLDRGVIARNFVACELFQGLAVADLQAVFRHGKVIKLPVGAMLMEENQDNDHLYVLLHGTMEVYLPENDIRFDRVPVTNLGPGDCIGEYSFVDDRPTSASVVAVEESALFKIQRDELLELMEQNKGLGMAVYRNLLLLMISRLRHSNEDMGFFL